MEKEHLFTLTRQRQLERVEKRFTRAQQIVQQDGGASTIDFVDGDSKRVTQIVVDQRFLFGMWNVRRALMNDVAGSDLPTAEELESREVAGD